MTKCSSCGKVIDRVPAWLDGVKVEFVCNNCPNRSTKNIASLTMEEVFAPAKVDDDLAEDLGDEEDADLD